MFDRVDPELAPALQPLMEAIGGAISIRDIPGARAQMAAMGEATRASLPEIPGIAVSDHQVPGYDGGPELLVRLYTPENRAGLAPGLLWIHGGGFVLGNVEQDDFRCRGLAKNTGCVVASVEYRLAPETTHPGPLNDCYAALLWLAEHAPDLGVDRQRVAIGGASAGAGLAAGLGLFARDQGEVNVAYQLLIYPMLDDCNVAPASDALPDTLVWSRESNLIGWRSLLGQEPGSEGVSMYAAPSRATDLSGLPPTYICVGDIDLFVAEDIDYAQRLLAAGVPTELHVYPGAYHGFDGFAANSRLGRQFNDDRDAALRNALGSDPAS
jgi:acetyl esterase/lipase